GRRPLDRPAGLQPAEHAQPPVRTRREATLVVVVEQWLRADRGGHVEAATDLEAVEPRCRDADDFRRMGRQVDLLTDGSGVTRVPALPEGVAEHGPRVAAGTIV